MKKIKTTQNPKTQISNLMLQWNYEHKTFDNSNTKLLPDLNADPRSNTQNLKPKTQKPKSQISCYNGTMNMKPLTLGPQNFYHTSMETPEAKHKTLNPKRKFQSSTLNFNGLVQQVN